MYHAKMASVIECERNFAKLWTQCQRCQVRSRARTARWQEMLVVCVSRLSPLSKFLIRQLSIIEPQGDLHKDVLCTSRDCPIFYKRKKVSRRLLCMISAIIIHCPISYKRKKVHDLGDYDARSRRLSLMIPAIIIHDLGDHDARSR